MPRLGRGEQVEVPTTHPLLDILEPVELLRGRSDGLREEVELPDDEGRFAPSGERRSALRAHHVTRIEVADPRLVRRISEHVGSEEELKGAREVVDVRERGATVDTERPQSPGDPKALALRFHSGRERRRARPNGLGRDPSREGPRIGFPPFGPPPRDLLSPFVLERGLVGHRWCPTGAGR